MSRVNEDGPRAKQRAEDVAVLCDPDSPAEDFIAAAERLKEHYSGPEMVAMMREAQR